MKKNLVILLSLIFLLSQFNGISQEIKKMDRKKWKELVEEIRKKRYDPKEKPYDQSSSATEYYSTEESDYNNYSGNSSESTFDDEGGIYDSGTGDDEIFFSEENDKSGNGGGNTHWDDGDMGDVDSKYNDGDGTGTGEGEGTNDGSGEYNKWNEKVNEEDVYYEKDKPRPQPQHTPKSSTSSSSSSGGGGGGNVLLIILIIILAAALIYMILVSFGNKNKKVKPVESIENKFENLTITKSELELALEAALKDNNFREAVRIYFIAVIKEMKDRRWIKWEKKKTNYHYINEISGRNQQPDFITATRAFEIVWYGNRSIAAQEYAQIEPVFKKLISSINS